MNLINQKLEEIHEKTRTLIGLYHEMRQQLQQALEENQQLRAEIQDKNHIIAELESKLKSWQLGKSLEQQQANPKLKKLINEYIKEIDQCLALLNN